MEGKKSARSSGENSGDCHKCWFCHELILQSERLKLIPIRKWIINLSKPNNQIFEFESFFWCFSKKAIKSHEPWWFESQALGNPHTPIGSQFSLRQKVSEQLFVFPSLYENSSTKCRFVARHRCTWMRIGSKASNRMNNECPHINWFINYLIN